MPVLVGACCRLVGALTSHQSILVKGAAARAGGGALQVLWYVRDALINDAELFLQLLCLKRLVLLMSWMSHTKGDPYLLLPAFNFLWSDLWCLVDLQGTSLCVGIGLQCHGREASSQYKSVNKA